jgi:hypothetical protein
MSPESVEAVLVARRQRANQAMTTLRQYRATLEADPTRLRAFDAAVEPVWRLLYDALNACDFLHEALEDLVVRQAANDANA